MKKILSILALAATASYVQAQGTIAVYTIASAYKANVNATAQSVYAGGTQTGGTSVLAPLNSGYTYDLLVSVFSPALTGTPTVAEMGAMTVGVSGITNGVTAGGIAGPGHSTGGPSANWGAPNLTYTDGTEDSYTLVGWSSNLGSTWSQVYAILQAGGTSIQGALFGATSFGYGYSGGGPNSLPAPSVFGVSTAEPGGLAAGPTLYSVTVPEPTSMALAAIGGLSLMALRRKKA